MNCMKCGRELKESGQVFCPDCLAGFADYPVKPGTPIQLPPRRPAAEAPKPPRRKQKPEEQIAALSHRVKILAVALFIALAAFFAVAALCLSLLEVRNKGQTSNPPSTENTQMFHGKHLPPVEYDCFT